MGDTNGKFRMERRNKIGTMVHWVFRVSSIDNVHSNFYYNLYHWLIIFNISVQKLNDIWNFIIELLSAKAHIYWPAVNNDYSLPRTSQCFTANQ